MIPELFSTRLIVFPKSPKPAIIICPSAEFGLILSFSTICSTFLFTPKCFKINFSFNTKSKGVITIVIAVVASIKSYHSLFKISKFLVKDRITNANSPTCDNKRIKSIFWSKLNLCLIPINNKTNDFINIIPNVNPRIINGFSPINLKLMVEPTAIKNIPNKRDLKGSISLSN